MLHIIQHPKSKKYELVAVAKNGDYLVGSNQGYEKKAGVYKAIRSLIKSCFAPLGGASIFIQDDTTTQPGVWAISLFDRVFQPDVKPSKKYTPSKAPSKTVKANVS